MDEIRKWWRTSIIDMKPGYIGFRGKPIEEIIGDFSLVDMIWYMLQGERPHPEQAQLLEAALVAGVDHGPQAPSIAAARMAITCGVGLNNAMGSAVNMLGDVHGGAGEQCAELFYSIRTRLNNNGNNGDSDVSLNEITRQEIEKWQASHGKVVSGYGHRFHKPVDPRAPRLMGLVEAANHDTIDKTFVAIGQEVEKVISKPEKPIPMNIDGATAVIFCALGLPAPLSRGLFCLSRSVGILAHAWEQKQQGGRNKGPMPPSLLPLYEGPSKNRSEGKL